MSVDVLEHLWEGLAHQWFPLGGHGGYDNFFVPWPGLRLVQGLSKALSAKEPHGEAEGGTGSQFGCSFWASFWVPVQSLDILHILGRGRGFPQLIHTQKCWDEKRDQILFPLQARRGTVLHLTHRKMVAQRDPQAAPSLEGSAMDSAGFCHLPRQRNHSHPAVAPLVMQTRF